MAIDKINSGGLGDNLELPGTEAAKMPIGTTAQRASAAQGDLRFNSTLSLMEYYDGTGWKSIDSPPVVSSISPTVESDANANITITGSFFATGATVKFVGDDGTEYASPSVTRNSSTEIVATTPATALSVANEPYDVVVTNVSGLSGTLADALDAGGVPAFNESAGSLGTVYDSVRTGLSFDAGATDPDGDTITYSVSVGTLPSGLSLNTSTGEISGDADAVGSDTTTTFTISAATASDTSTRQFSITVAAPVVTSYTSTGSGTFSVPSGISAVDVLVVAGGGGGGGFQSGPAYYHAGGGGGAGGLIYRPSFPVTPGGSVSYTVGAGGSVGGAPRVLGFNGQDSVFGSLTAKGGGSGGSVGSSDPSRESFAEPGGSGGGEGSPNQPVQPGGTGIQPQQPGDSGTYGFGNPGGPALSGGGGGAGGGGSGAAAQGTPPVGTTGEATDGGIGKQYDIGGQGQVYYAGGGGGGAGGNPALAHTPGSGGQGGGGDASTWNPSTPTAGNPGTANRGGGGGGASSIGDTGQGASHPNTAGGTGGSGIVIVKY